MTRQKRELSDRPQPPQTLRERAEAMLRASQSDITAMPAEDVQRLVHELQVHQMELEIQNEELREAQAELAESRDRYADLYEFAPVGYVTLDKDGKILEANLTAADMLRVQRRSLRGMRLSQFTTRGSSDELHQHRLAVFSSDVTQTCEIELLVTEAGRLVARLESVAFEADDQRRCRTALVDVTRRKEAEEELTRLNEELERRVDERTQEIRLLAEAISHLGEGVLITDDQLDWPGPRIRFVNNALCRITGYTAAELIGQTPRVLQAEGTDRATLDRIRVELAAGRSCKMELVNYRKDGTPYDAELFITPLWDSHGRRTNFVSIHRDITQRKQAEAALRDSEERLRTILNTAADAIITIDHGGVITNVNAATEKMFGYSQQELVGRNVNMLMPSPYADQHDGYVRRYLETGEARIIGVGREAIGRRKDGSTFPVGLAIAEVHHLQLFTGVVRDISTVKELRKQVLETAAEEARRIGHELHDNLQQQLTGLGLLAQSLAESLAAASAEQAGMAARLADGIRQSAHDVHLLSRGLVPVEVDAEGLRAALSELAARIREQYGIDCRFHRRGSIDLTDNFAATHLYRIAQEAVTNAVKHGQAGRIEIILAGGDETITLTVLDNGVGIGDKREAGPGMGLRIMQYRAGLIGATLFIGPVEECGTQVVCTVLRGGG